VGYSGCIQERIDDPRSRQQEPLWTSSHVQSPVKLCNGRVKGAEESWDAADGKVILQLRMTFLSEPARPGVTPEDATAQPVPPRDTPRR
jgi:hypothetical protein